MKLFMRLWRRWRHGGHVKNWLNTLLKEFLEFVKGSFQFLVFAGLCHANSRAVDDSRPVSAPHISPYPVFDRFLGDSSNKKLWRFFAIFDFRQDWSQQDWS